MFPVLSLSSVWSCSADFGSQSSNVGAAVVLSESIFLFAGSAAAVTGISSVLFTLNSSGIGILHEAVLFRSYYDPEPAGPTQVVPASAKSNTTVHHFIRQDKDWQPSLFSHSNKKAPIQICMEAEISHPRTRSSIFNRAIGQKKVPRAGIEPATRGFSVLCSTN